MAYIYQDKIEDQPMADETFAELQRRFPKSDHLVDIYFHNYLDGLRKDNKDKIQLYKNLILTQFPDSKQARIVSQPDYFKQLQYAAQVEDSLYEATYNAYLKSDFSTVKTNTATAECEIPMTKLMPRFLFLNAISVAKTETQKDFVVRLQDLVARYPDSEPGSMAKEMLAMMNQEMEVQQGEADNATLLNMRIEQELAEGIDCPIMGIFGNEDKNPPPEEVDRTEEVLKELGKTYEFYRYDGAGHGIWYYDKPMYRQEQAMDSWNKALEFLDRYLK